MHVLQVRILDHQWGLAHYGTADLDQRRGQWINVNINGRLGSIRMDNRNVQYKSGDKWYTFDEAEATSAMLLLANAPVP